MINNKNTDKDLSVFRDLRHKVTDKSIVTNDKRQKTKPKLTYKTNT